MEGEGESHGGDRHMRGAGEGGRGTAFVHSFRVCLARSHFLMHPYPPPLLQL